MKIVRNTSANIGLVWNNALTSGKMSQQVFAQTKFDSHLIQRISFSYVKIKDIEAVKQQYKPKGNLKVFQKVSGFYMSQVWHDFKADYNLFKSIKLLAQSQRTAQQKHLYHKILVDMIKFGPAFVIANVPFGFVLFYTYLKLFPQLIPSWMMVDLIYEKIEKRRDERRVNAWKYYQQNFEQNVIMPYLKEAIFKQNQSLQDMRRIACICYKDYQDGTEYLSQKLGLQFKSGLILPRISLALLKYNLENEIKHDYAMEKEFEELGSFEEKLYLKLGREVEKLK